jgi:hypothetical protein
MKVVDIYWVQKVLLLSFQGEYLKGLGHILIVLVFIGEIGGFELQTHEEASIYSQKRLVSEMVLQKVVDGVDGGPQRQGDLIGLFLAEEVLQLIEDGLLQFGIVDHDGHVAHEMH